MKPAFDEIDCFFVHICSGLLYKIQYKNLDEILEKAGEKKKMNTDSLYAQVHYFSKDAYHVWHVLFCPL